MLPANLCTLRIASAAMFFVVPGFPLAVTCGEDPVDSEIAKVISDLEHPESEVKNEGYAAIRHKYRQRAEPAIPVLIDQLKADPETTDHTQVCKALAAIGPASVPEVVKLLKSENAYWKDLVLYVLRMNGKTAPAVAVPPLIASLNDASPAIRSGSLRALESIGPSEEVRDAVPVIAKLMYDTDSDVSNRAAMTLASIGPGAQSAVPVLLSYMEDHGTHARGVAIYTLRAIGPPAREASKTLIPYLDNELLREQAALALRQIGVSDPEELSMLIDRVDHSALRTRQLAISILGRAGSEASVAVETLIESLDDPHTTQFSIHALGQIGPDAAASVPNLVSFLSSDQYHLRAGAAEALGRIGPPAQKALPALRALSNDANALVQQHANRAIAQISTP